MGSWVGGVWLEAAPLLVPSACALELVSTSACMGEWVGLPVLMRDGDRAGLELANGNSVSSERSSREYERGRGVGLLCSPRSGRRCGAQWGLRPGLSIYPVPVELLVAVGLVREVKHIL